MIAERRGQALAQPTRDEKFYVLHYSLSCYIMSCDVM